MGPFQIFLLRICTSVPSAAQKELLTSGQVCRILVLHQMPSSKRGKGEQSIYKTNKLISGTKGLRCSSSLHVALTSSKPQVFRYWQNLLAWYQRHNGANIRSIKCVLFGYFMELEVKCFVQY